MVHHFVPRPDAVPGCALCAQAGGILLYKSIPEPDKKISMLSKIDNTKFRKPVVPGDQLRLEVEMIKLKSRFCHVRGRALVDGEVVVEGEVMASLMNLEEMYEQG